MAGCMRGAHASHAEILCVRMGAAVYSRCMKHVPGRFVAVNLSEAEYQAVRAITDDPAAWLKRQVDELLARRGLAHLQPAIPGIKDDPLVAAWSYTIRG